MCLLSAQQYRAFWVDAFNRGFKSPAEIEELLDNAVTARANAIFMQVRRRGDVYYLRSEEPPAQDATYSPNFDALDYMLHRAHDRGLEVHAWFVMTRLWTSSTPPADPRHLWHAHGPGAQGDAMWMTVSATGQVGNSLDPGHPEAAKYLSDLVVNAVRDYPELDGIHLDYIRYPEDADYGWNPTAVARFQRLENRTEIPARTDPLWAEFRRRQVTALVRQIYLRACAIKPAIKVSAALISWGSGPTGEDADAAYRRLDAYARVFQDWRAWLEEGILDLGIPMNYFAEARNAAFLDRWLEFEKDRQFGRGILIGLAPYLNPLADTLAQIGRALAPSRNGNRPLGVSLYSYASTNLNNTEPRENLYRALGEFFAERADPPVLSWKADPQTGHLYGRLQVDGGPQWLHDGVTVVVESDETGERVRTLTTDGTGFFGAVDLPPGRYFLRLLQNGNEVFRTHAQELGKGQYVPFEIFLKAEDFPSPVQAAAGASAAR